MDNFRFLIPSCGITALLISSLACCEDDHNAQRSSYSSLTDWSSICLGPLLLDIPKPVEMSATEDRFRDVYGFQGIDDVGGGKGVRFNGLTIYETVPTNAKRFGDLQRGAAISIPSSAAYRADWPEIEQEILLYEKRALSGTLDERTYAKRKALSAQNDLKISKYGARVSGTAALTDTSSFAYRHGDKFSVGFPDTADQRARVFDGSITSTEIESPLAAAIDLKKLRLIYQSRAPVSIPTAAGFCTVFGTIQGVIQPQTDYLVKIPFRSLKYPNLLFTLSVSPAEKRRVANIQHHPDLGEEKADLHLVGVNGKYGPKRVTILGAPGRSIGYKFGDNCSPDSCRPADQAYEIEAETYGELGQPHKPQIVLHMIAATSDEYKLKLPKEPRYADYAVPQRPILAGHVPPPFEEGIKIFETVLHSIRLRPGALAQQPTPSTSAAKR